MARVAQAAAITNPPVAAPSKRSKKKLIVIFTILLTVLGMAGAAALFALKQTTNHSEEQQIQEPLGPPTFVVLDQFVVNLAEPDTSRYLQIGITYEVNGPKVAEEIKTFTPVIRSRILLVMSGKNVSDLNSIEGKQQLMDELVDLARVTIKGNDNDPTRGIRDVHFSSFVIQ
jgi:flagellar FliL protein